MSSNKEATTLHKVRKQSITWSFIFLVWWPIKEIVFLSKGKDLWPFKFHFRQRLLSFVRSSSAAWGLGPIKNTISFKTKALRVESGLCSLSEEKRNKIRSLPAKLGLGLLTEKKLRRRPLTSSGNLELLNSI